MHQVGSFVAVFNDQIAVAVHYIGVIAQPPGEGIRATAAIERVCKLVASD